MHWEKSGQGRVINRERKTEELAGAQQRDQGSGGAREDVYARSEYA